MKQFYLFTVILFSIAISAQEKKPNIAKFFIGVNSAQNTYYGALNDKGYSFSVNNNYAFSGDLGINYRRWIATLSYESGKYSYGKNATTDHRNFLCDYGKVSFVASYKIRLNKVLSIVPGIGVSSWSCGFSTDTLNAAGQPYHYWSDGTIRNLPETYNNYLSSNVAYEKRDYKYETSLGNKSFFSVPLKLAVYFDVTPSLSLYFGSTYNYMLSNNIDLTKTPSKNNFVLSNYVGASYVFMRKPDPDKMTKEQKAFYAALEKVDEDGDGVRDFDDKCPTEGKLGKVDNSGCPIDDDNDGIIDQKDKEQKTKKHAIVDTEGRTIIPGDAVTAEEYSKDLDLRLNTSNEETAKSINKEIEAKEWPHINDKPKFIDLNDPQTKKYWNDIYDNYKKK